MTERGMTRREMLAVTGAGAAAMAGRSCFGKASRKKPNVLFIAIDDLNDWVGCLGGHPQTKTPHIDRLAKRGVVFDNAHCQAPICNPSRVSLMLGKLPSTTGIYFLQPTHTRTEKWKDTVTLPQHFAANGYATAGVGKLFHAPLKGAFQSYGGRFGGFGPLPKQKLNYKTGHKLWDWGAFPERDDQMPDTKTADWAIEQLNTKLAPEAAAGGKPFFLAVGIFRPHVPLYAPKKWFDLYPLESVQLPKVLASDLEDIPKYGLDLTAGFPAPRHEWFVKSNQWRPAVQAYMACVSFADHCVGRVLDALDKSGQADNTIIVLWGDHGWHLGEKLRWAKRSLWEESTQVPLAIVAPGRTQGGRCSKPVGLIDLFPTLVDLCEIAPGKGLDGASIAPLLTDPKATWDRPTITTFGRNNHAVRSEHWRYIRYANGSQELYDHRTDPNEWRNVAADPAHAGVIADHARHLPRLNVLAVPNSTGSGSPLYGEGGDKVKPPRKK